MCISRYSNDPYPPGSPFYKKNECKHNDKGRKSSQLAISSFATMFTTESINYSNFLRWYLKLLKMVPCGNGITEELQCRSIKTI